jgi:hypothetical protein
MRASSHPALYGLAAALHHGEISLAAIIRERPRPELFVLFGEKWGGGTPMAAERA